MFLAVFDIRVIARRFAKIQLAWATDFLFWIFALARTSGWISQWKEMIEDPKQKIGRPRQLYTGAAKRDFVDIENR